MCKTNETITKGAPSIEEYMSQFKDEKAIMDYLIKHIFPDGKIVCAHCGCTEKIYPSNRTMTTFGCGHCRKNVVPFNGTIFENTHIAFKTWMYIIYSCFVARRSKSALQMARELNCSDSSILNTRRLIQTAMANYDLKPFTGVVEMDEAFIGGSNHGRFCKEWAETGQKKYPILGIYESRTHRVYSYPAKENAKGQYLTSKQLQEFIEKTCKPKSTIVTDDFKSYRFLNKKENGYRHETVDHKHYEYTNEKGYTTRRIESYWAILKRMYYGTHSWFSRKYAHLYLAECDFRYNYPIWDEAIKTLLNQAVLIPQVIDVRYMGKFANKTYDLKNYRIILPKKFDDTNLKDITAEDIITCEEPVYGILRKPYLSRMQRRMGGTYKDEWAELGLIKYGNDYKDYRNVIVNTKKDLEDMIKDAEKHKDVNTSTNIPSKKPVNKERCAAMRRNHSVRKRYARMPEIIRSQLDKEFPNLIEMTDLEETKKFHSRIASLLHNYKIFVEATCTTNDFIPIDYDKELHNKERRMKHIRDRYNKLPIVLKKQIFSKFPNIFELSTVEETKPIHTEMNTRLRLYNIKKYREERGITEKQLKAEQCAKRRQKRLIKRYQNLPKPIKEKIIKEYPNLLEISEKNEVWNIHQRLNKLVYEYEFCQTHNADEYIPADVAAGKRRNNCILNAYKTLSLPIRKQILEEYPNALAATDRKDTTPIRRRMTELSRNYDYCKLNGIVDVDFSDTKYVNNIKCRKKKMMKKFDSLPSLIQMQIVSEFPNILKVYKVEDMALIHLRIKHLLYLESKKKSINFLKHIKTDYSSTLAISTNDNHITTTKSLGQLKKVVNA